jgi:hypothetical protein
MLRRVRSSRRRGWRKPAGAIVVSRPTRWGNPFAIDARTSRADAVERYADALRRGELGFSAADVVRELAGHDLACWCPLDGPCHADVLLLVANGSTRSWGHANGYTERMTNTDDDRSDDDPAAIADDGMAPMITNTGADESGDVDADAPSG